MDGLPGEQHKPDSSEKTEVCFTLLVVVNTLQLPRCNLKPAQVHRQKEETKKRSCSPGWYVAGLTARELMNKGFLG